uniref:F-box domain-containing protein n=1 Tax=Salarias fasciatus TaxID=181472 RepID=A0A672FXA0_SALFA
MAVGRKASRNEGKSRWSEKSSQLCKRLFLRPRQPRTVPSRRQAASPGVSYLDRLPVELFDMILDKLSVLEISVFSMVSKDICRYIMDYISTLAWKKKAISSHFHHPSCPEWVSTIQHYRDLGLLFKRCTLLLPTKERLRFIFNKFTHVPCFTLEQCLTPQCSGFSSYGIFLQTLIAGWDELECHRVFNFLCDNINLLQRTEAVITANFQELQLRFFCRRVLLDPWSQKPEGDFWLLQLLQPWPMVSQAHLLFILYGPLMPEGVLAWQDLVERELPHQALWDLAQAILMLFSQFKAKHLTVDSIPAIFEELIVIPQPWHVLNVARLLVLCGNDFCFTFLASKALNGRLPEISRLIVFIILVCEKDGYHMNWAVKLVKAVCDVFAKVNDKYNFIQQLESKFSEVTREFFEMSVSGEAGLRSILHPKQVEI